ncbi:hypothetical protein [Methylomonas sp. UP202]|uniref:hypothetical protein n=1 Tax=Methylomonas sp. UP202 TaxID=3040943 RepID=UPI002478F70A|nr:hypothetical protein [Methylomonas sp. UP202]WGS87214.1 hypothetical protein QC632_05550 [Methylomonas sp. UP202]
MNPVSNSNPLLLKGAGCWLLVALVMAWCLVGLHFELAPLQALFPGKPARLLQAHLDFLLMSALLLGFYGARFPLPAIACWAMVIGAFTNSSLFLLMAMFPVLDDPAATGVAVAVFKLYTFASIVTTSFGFGRAAWAAVRHAAQSA